MSEIAEWIDHVDRLRLGNEALAAGQWHGYTEAPGGEAPMRGHYLLVRWALPTVAVAHDDPDEAIRLAVLVERALGEL